MSLKPPSDIPDFLLPSEEYEAKKERVRGPLRRLLHIPVAAFWLFVGFVLLVSCGWVIVHLVYWVIKGRGMEELALLEFFFQKICPENIQSAQSTQNAP